MSVSMIIPAAGTGTRMNSKMAKQFLSLGGIPVLSHLIKRADMIDDISEIIIAVKEDEIDNLKNNVLNAVKTDKEIKIVTGGLTRQDSVAAALKKVSKKSNIVMVHDAVRPFVTVMIMENAIKRTKELKATVTAVKVKDTIKKVQKGVVTATLEREKLYLIQTPQTFLREILIKAHDNAKKNGIIGTDEASLVEAIGEKVHIIPGSYDNIKITTKEDIAIGNVILKKQKSMFDYIK